MSLPSRNVPTGPGHHSYHGPSRQGNSTSPARANLRIVPRSTSRRKSETHQSTRAETPSFHSVAIFHGSTCSTSNTEVAFPYCSSISSISCSHASCSRQWSRWSQIQRTNLLAFFFCRNVGASAAVVPVAPVVPAVGTPCLDLVQRIPKVRKWQSIISLPDYFMGRHGDSRDRLLLSMRMVIARQATRRQQTLEAQAQAIADFCSQHALTSILPTVQLNLCNGNSYASKTSHTDKQCRLCGCPQLVTRAYGKMKPQFTSCAKLHNAFAPFAACKSLSRLFECDAHTLRRHY